MAKYTMQLRQIPFTSFNSYMNEYPIFDEAYRDILNNKIYKTCKFKEIGFETPELFLEHLNIWMELHMPDFNHLYKAMALELDPLHRREFIERFEKDRDLNTNFSGENHNLNITSSESESHTDSSGSSTDTNVNSETSDTTSSSLQNTDNRENTSANGKNSTYYSDFPQGNLSGEGLGDTGGPIESKYFTKSDDSLNTDVSENQVIGKVDSTDNSLTLNESDSRSTNINSNENNSSSSDSSSSKTDSDYSNLTTSKELENYTLTKTGHLEKTDFAIIEEFKEYFVNVDLKIIKALKKEMFMTIH